MPLYEYSCAECGRFEIIQKFSDSPNGLGTGCAKGLIAGYRYGNDYHDLVRINFEGYAGTADREGPIFDSSERNL